MNNKSLFDSKFDHNFTSVERKINVAFLAVIFVWIVGIIASLALTGTIVWAIFKLVTKFVS